MTTILLLIITLGVLVMGYRFYAKFLALGVFRTNVDAKTPALRRGGSHDFVASDRFALFADNTAAMGALALLGVTVAALWGWIPAFLWVVAGTLAIGGAYAFGSLRASLRRSGDSLAGITFDLVGIWGALPLYALGVFLLCFLCALMSVLLGQLLHAHPESAWSLLFLLLIPLLLRRAPAALTTAATWVWVSVGVALFLIGVTLGQWSPLSVSGNLRVSAGSAELFSFPQGLFWTAIILMFSYSSVKAPVTRFFQPKSSVVGILILLLAALVALGLILSAAPLVAPDFQLDGELPSLFPLLFLVISGGAVCGIHAMMITGPTVRRIRHQRDAPGIAYGSMVVVAGLAVLLLLALCAGFGTEEEWRSVYGFWPDQAALYIWLDLAVVKMARFVASCGMPLSWAVGMTAAVVASMILILLEYALRTLAYAMEEGVEDFELGFLKGPHYRERLAVGITAATALWMLQVEPSLKHWLLFGLTNQLFAGVFLMVLTVLMTKLSRNTTFLLIPALFMLTVALWGLVWLLLDWWQKQEWFLFVTSLILGGLALLSLIVCLNVLMKSRQQHDDAVSMRPSL